MIGLNLKMSFFHILPSNTSPNYFPKNNASNYSTPIENSYILNGDWEVALMNMTYSTCVNTYNNDEITVKEKMNFTELYKLSEKPLKIKIEIPKDIDTTYQLCKALLPIMNKAMEGVLNLTEAKSKETGYFKWNLLIPGGIIIMSKSFKDLFKLWTDVITSWDPSPTNYFPVPRDSKFNPKDYDDFSIIAIPLKAQRLKYVIKSKNESLPPNEVVTRFNEKIPSSVAVLSFGDKHFEVHKLHDDGNCVVMNHQFLDYCYFRQGGIFYEGHLRFGTYNPDNYLKDEWCVYMYPDIYRNLTSNTTELVRTIVLKPVKFSQHASAVAFLNQTLNDSRIKISIDASNILTLKITDDKLTITFDKNLQDILAFSKSSYKGSGSFVADAAFSLTRRIQYLFVYSNVGEYIRVGDTEAPLIAILPFNAADKTCSLLKEKVFNTPMYVHVSRDRISQIDIGIYDGAGQLVPFIDESVTTLRLHFRQL